MIRPSPHRGEEDGAKSQSHRILHQAEAAADVVAFDADADLVRVAEEGRGAEGKGEHRRDISRAPMRAGAGASPLTCPVMMPTISSHSTALIHSFLHTSCREKHCGQTAFMRGICAGV